MLRILRAVLTRETRIFRVSLSSSKSLHFVSPPLLPHSLSPRPYHFVSLHDFCTSGSSVYTEKNGNPQSSSELESAMESEADADENLETAVDGEGTEEEETKPWEDEATRLADDDSEHVAAVEGGHADECSQESAIHFTSESGEECAIDMSNVPDELKEMLQDGYIIVTPDEEFPTEENAELLTLEEVKEVLEEVRARDVQVFPVQDRCEWTDIMVVATGISDRHVRGIADALVYKIKKKGNIESSLYPTVEGQVGGKWLVVDLGNIVIHVLNEDSRGYYKLEDLWTGDVKPSTADEDLEKMLEQAGLKSVVP